MYSVVLMMAVTSGGEVADFGRRRGGCYGCYGGGGLFGGGLFGRRRGGYGGGCYGGGYGGCNGGGYAPGCYGGMPMAGGCNGGSAPAPTNGAATNGAATNGAATNGAATNGGTPAAPNRVTYPSAPATYPARNYTRTNRATNVVPTEVQTTTTTAPVTPVTIQTTAPPAVTPVTAVNTNLAGMDGVALGQRGHGHRGHGHHHHTIIIIDGGCSGCFGGCFGGYLGGCHGGGFSSCFGGCYGGGWHHWGHHGCCGGWGHGCCGGDGHHHHHHKDGKKDKDEDKGKKGKGGEEVDEEEVSTDGQAAPARLEVSLPADATLKIDGAATRATGARRAFVTPNLPAGRNFRYTLQIQAKDKDGKPVNWEQKVTVRAGKTSRISLAPPTTVASR